MKQKNDPIRERERERGDPPFKKKKMSVTILSSPTSINVSKQKLWQKVREGAYKALTPGNLNRSFWFGDHSKLLQKKKGGLLVI